MNLSFSAHEIDPNDIDIQDLVSEDDAPESETALQNHGTNQIDALQEQIEELSRRTRNSLSNLTVSDFNELSEKFESISAEIEGTSRNPGIAVKLEQLTGMANKISYALAAGTAAAESLNLSQSDLKKELNGIRAAISGVSSLADVLKSQTDQLHDLTSDGGNRIADGIARRLASPENQERIALQLGVLTRNATDDLATRFAERLESDPVKLGIEEALHSLIEAETAKLKTEISQSKIKSLITADAIAKLQIDMTAATATIKTLEKSRNEAVSNAEKYRNLHNTLLDKINHGSFFGLAWKFVVTVGVLFLAGVEITKYL